MILTVATWIMLCEKQATFDKHVLDQYALTEVPIWERTTAYRVEAAECINELKGAWKWWSVKEPQRERFVEELIDALKFVAGIAMVDASSSGPIWYHAMFHKAHDYHIRNNDELKRLCHAAVDAKNIRRSFGALLLIAEHLDVNEEEIVTVFDAKTETNLERILIGY